jgi:hypothetical protein
MRKYVVYYFQGKTWGRDFDETEVDLINYRAVASLFADDLEDVFRLTNNRERSWRYNPHIKLMDFQPESQRSTSAGDLIRDDEKFYIVAPMGFREVSVK